jgi:hypothetical protein
MSDRAVGRRGMARNAVRKRFWFEVGCGFVGAILFVVTLISKEWIEEIFGVDPDRGSGALEWAIALSLLAIAATSFALARREWRLALA